MCVAVPSPPAPCDCGAALTCWGWAGASLVAGGHPTRRNWSSLVWTWPLVGSNCMGGEADRSVGSFFSNHPSYPSDWLPPLRDISGAPGRTAAWPRCGSPSRSTRAFTSWTFRARSPSFPQWWQSFNPATCNHALHGPGLSGVLVIVNIQNAAYPPPESTPAQEPVSVPSESSKVSECIEGPVRVLPQKL